MSDTSKSADGSTVNKSPPYWKCNQCGDTFAIAPVPESRAARGNHARAHATRHLDDCFTLVVQ